MSKTAAPSELVEKLKVIVKAEIESLKAQGMPDTLAREAVAFTLRCLVGEYRDDAKKQ